ncbi:glycosyltransferase [Kocuria sp. U4B]
MHADESRDPQEFDRIEFEHSLRDAEGLRLRIRELERREADARRRAGALDQELQDAVRTNRTLQRRAQRAEAQLKEERSKHGTTYAKYEAYKAETARLKDDLKRLRASTSLKVGRGVLAPVTAVRRSWARGGDGSRTPEIEAGNPLPALPPATEPAQPQPAQPAPPRLAAAAAPRLSELSTVDLLSWFEAAPDGQRLGQLLGRLWYDEGQISRPAQLLHEHEKLVADLPESRQDLAAQIPAAARLIERVEAMVPRRSPGAAYVAERRRVMYCVNQSPVHTTNGYATRTQGVARGLVENGWNVRVVSRLGYPWDTELAASVGVERSTTVLEGLEYVHLSGGDLRSDPRDHYLLAAADAYVREARLFRPSMIHAASNHVVGLAALIAARRLGVPFVYEVRGLWELSEASARPGWEDTERFGQQVRLETLVATEADRVVAITEQIKQELVDRGVPEERITVVPNAVDPAEMLPLPVDRAYAASKKIAVDRPVIGFAGSLVPYEGLDVLLRAAAELRDRDRKFQVIIAGAGTALTSLQRLRDELDLGETVRFLGRLPGSEMPRLISTFTVMPCPRLSARVTELVSPLKPLESFAAAKAVVLSDVAPHRDLAGPDETRAVLFPAGDARALADTLDGLLGNPDRVRALGRRARLWTVDERTWDLMGRRVVDAYAAAAATAADLVDDGSVRRLGELRVGIIADEFTTETLRPSVHLVPLDPRSWRDQLEQEALDLVLVESAWKGNGGAWHGKVGYYDDESFADLRKLLHACRTRGLPTLFWNKEDPVHFNRFARTAARCDHVFTTDAGRVGAYLSLSHHQITTVSSMPFYAQPAIHNPLPGAMPAQDTVSYAGSYYGDRYKERSQQLLDLLEPLTRTGLTIYDRQHDDPASPYRFPPQLAPFVAGSLPYEQVLDAYKAHVANINVNSVGDSPTMFSRRVVEIAASGGVVLSGPGRGLQETLGDLVPVGGDRRRTESLVSRWSRDPDARLAEAWHQMRGVLRAHTVDTALTLMARTAGLVVDGLRLPDYALVLEDASAELVDAVAHQSVLPREVVLHGEASPASVDMLRREGIRVSTSTTGVRTEWIGVLRAPVTRTWAEDLLHGTRFGQWVRLGSRELWDAEDSRPMTRVLTGLPHEDGLVRTELVEDGDVSAACRTASGPTLEMIVPQTVAHRPANPAPAARTGTTGRPGGLRVLVAGHDLKFAGPWLDHLRAHGHTVLIDQWRSHTAHDEERSRELLDQADVVFCEWGLGNLKWYSRHVLPHQRLVARVHLQEIDRPYLHETQHDNVDAYVFVGELIRRAAVEGHGVPADRAVVIPNIVDVDGLARPKSDDARFTLGFAGMVPQRKRLDLAVLLLEKLLEKDSRYKLRVKGRRPEEYPWMKDRPQEFAYYEDVQASIDALNAEHPGAVVFDGFGADMAQWYSRIGVAVSTSDFESFHLTVADGAASGAVAASLDWDGADLIYPRPWLSADIDEMAGAIHETVRNEDLFNARGRAAQQFVRAHMDGPTVFARLDAALKGDR